MMHHFTTLPVVDAHLHLWDLKKMHYPWLETVPAIKKSFFIEDYQKASKDFPVEKMVFVQADCLLGENMAEVQFVEEQAGKDRRIKGMVAYAPVEQGKDVKKTLETLRLHPLVKGVRRMYDNDPGLCRSSLFIEGLRLLPSYGFSFDISIKPYAMKETIDMIGSCPDTQFILDHLGKPDILNQKSGEYKRYMEQLSAFPNVAAKISGLITEADLNNWTPEDLRPYIVFAINCFGPERLMFGSDWPVVLQGGTFGQWAATVQDILAEFPAGDLQAIFYKNAENIYRLNGPV